MILRKRRLACVTLSTGISTSTYSCARQRGLDLEWSLTWCDLTFTGPLRVYRT